MNEFTDAKNFKSYDELKKRLDLVLKGSPARIDREEYENDVAAEYQASAPAPAVPQSMKEELNAVSNTSDDTYSYFDSLANEEF